MRTTDRPRLAIGLMLAAVALFAVMDVIFKLLVAEHSSMQVAFMRCVLSMPIFAILMLGKPALFRSAYLLGHVLRGCIGIGLLFSVGEAFRELSLADAYTLFFCAPLLITLLSGPVLNEPASKLHIMMAVLGFFGVTLILRPGAVGFGYGAIMALIGMLCYTATTLLLRRLGERDAALTTAFYFTAFAALGSFPFAIQQWQPLRHEDWWLWLGLGLTGSAAQWLLTQAFRIGSAGLIAPFEYTAILWAVLFGYWVWDDLPAAQVAGGAILIIGCGLVISFTTHQQQAQLRTQSASESVSGESN